jgi:hypothetical protein
MNLLIAFTIILVIMAIGDIISLKTKAYIPSVFVSALIFIIGFWTILPKNLMETGGFSMPLVQLSMYLILVHMGTLMSIKELLSQWKIVLIAFTGIIGVVFMTMTIGLFLFGKQLVVIATPPLTGGMVASIMMAEAATVKHLPTLSLLAIIIYIMQGFAGYPLTAIMLKKEGRKLLKIYRKNNIKRIENDGENTSLKKSKTKLFPAIDKKYQTVYLLLAKTGFIAFLSVGFANITNEFISKYVICLIFGVIAAEIGFLERKPLNISGSFGFIMTIIMAFIFSQLSKSTPAMIKQLIIPLFGIIFLGVFGMWIFSIIAGKLLNISKEIAFSVSLTALYGFPPNYILTEEAATALAETKEEKEYLMGILLPQMLVGGFTTVTIVSVILAGIFIKFL